MFDFVNVQVNLQCICANAMRTSVCVCCVRCVVDIRIGGFPFLNSDCVIAMPMLNVYFNPSLYFSALAEILKPMSIQVRTETLVTHTHTL